MGSFWVSREGDGVHLYGYVFTGISTGIGRILALCPSVVNYIILKQSD